MLDGGKNGLSGFPIVIFPKHFRLTLLSESLLPSRVTEKVRQLDCKWIDSRGVKEAHTEPSQHQNIQLLVLGFLSSILAQQRDQTEVKGRHTVGKTGGKKIGRGILELETKSCDVPQEASKPSLKALTKLPGLHCFHFFKNANCIFPALCVFGGLTAVTLCF